MVKKKKKGRIHRLLDLREAFMEKLKRKRTTLYVVALFVEEAGAAWLTGTTMLSLIWRGFRWFIQQPIGFAGLAFLVYLIAILTVSWWETRLKPEVVPAPSTTELVALNDLRSLLRPHAVNASRWAQSTIDALLRNKAIQAATFSKQVRLEKEGLMNATDALRDALDDQDPAEARAALQSLVDFHAAYTEAVDTMHDCEKEGVTLVDMEAYQQWEDAHTAYTTKLSEKKEHAEFAPIRPHIEDIGLNTVEKKRFAVAYELAAEVLRNPAEEQARFLALFNDREAKSKTMPYKAYDAGRALGEMGVLEITDGPETGTSRIAIPRPTWRAWMDQGAIPAPMEPYVVVSLSDVEGTQASGGGTGGVQPLMPSEPDTEPADGEI